MTAPDIPPIPADWSQFFPDLFSGLIVALVVGALLGWWVRGMESRAEARTEKARMEAEKRARREEALHSWRRPQARMRANHMPRVVGSPGVMLHDYTNALEDWLRGFEEYPVEVWTLAAPDERDLKLVAELMALAPALRSACHRLFDAIGVAYRDGLDPWDNPRGTAEIEEYRGVTERAILGIEQSDSWSTTQQANHDAMMEDPPFRAELDDWISLRDRTASAQRELLELKNKRPDE